MVSGKMRRRYSNSLLPTYVPYEGVQVLGRIIEKVLVDVDTAEQKRQLLLRTLIIATHPRPPAPALLPVSGKSIPRPHISP